MYFSSLCKFLPISEKEKIYLNIVKKRFCKSNIYYNNNNNNIINYNKRGLKFFPFCNNLKKNINFVNINNKKGINFHSINKERKMASEVPQVVSLDPTSIPIEYNTPIHDIKVEVYDIKGGCNVEEGLTIFLVNNPGKENGPVKISSKVNDKNVSEFLKDENMEKFNVKLGTSKHFYMFNENKNSVAVGYVGCGSVADLNEADMKRVVLSLVTMLHDNKLSKLTVVFEINVDKNLFRFFLETLFYEYMTDERFKSTDKNVNMEYIKHLGVYINNADTYKQEVEKARVYYFGTYYASQLIAAPANYCNPVSLSNAAVELAEKLNLEYKILGVKELEELKMGAYLSVGKGSMYPNKFIHLTYKSKGDVKKKIALVGKGITFDSGGYNLKAAPGSMIDLMKFDMSGCAAVLGCAYCVGTLKPENVEIHFLSAVCENMVSKNSYRPGDIITASNGKTIEVGNTDAEGRLTLADALVYAEKLGVDYIVDIATLTGAMLYSLGTSYAGVFGNNEELINKILNSSKTSNEPVWWLPIINEYRATLNSKYADINNISSSVKASSIVASLFLKEFIQNTAWAHIDIAGVSWNFKARKPKGFGVRLLTEFVLNDAL
ncbi:M17 leucyl aminopeptidase [Plasmodium reichenowi]|uniref:Leucine aminopeptidase n=1 Tax=Plasmodium reichenowi TaxID=5854 RepID=A0A2P9DPT4_PLARE|nr:M17 leucyl aminopeptidase [Plasmodium reichenowi]